MKILKIVLLLLCTLGLNAAETVHPAKAQLLADFKAVETSVPSITPQELLAMNKAGEKFILVDVRNPDEVVLGKIDADKWLTMPRGTLEIQAIKSNGLPQDAKIVIYCAAGTRGALATQTLIHYGYTDIRNLNGGVKGWLKAGYPLVTKLGTFQKVSDSLTGLEVIK